MHSPGSNWRQILWVVVIWVIVLYFFRPLFYTSYPQEISYTDFKKRVDQGTVAEVTIKGSEIEGRFKSNQPAKGNTRETENIDNASHFFKTVMPSIVDAEILDYLEEKNLDIHAQTERRSWLATLLVTLLPWVLLIGFFIYSSKKFQERMGMGKGGGVFGFGKSKAKLYDRSVSQITFSDVAGLTNAK